jgi:Putative F0F1-ATPase subunit Ca2+/Mg2+ transporter
MQYAGMATQFLVVIGIAVFAGLKADQWLNWRVPVWVWVLPLLAIVGMIYGIIRSISNK